MVDNTGGGGNHKIFTTSECYKKPKWSLEYTQVLYSYPMTITLIGIGLLLRTEFVFGVLQKNEVGK